MRFLLFITFILILSQSYLPGSSASARGDGIPELVVPTPALSEDIFPCSQCHATMDPNPVQRDLMFHTEIAEGFNHAKEQRWCLDCHNLNDRDRLRLINGKLIKFEESYYLCGQCHGSIFRDWKAGVHGKRTGQWDGEKLYRLCVSCHNPHQPRFKALSPLPPPIKPETDVTKRKSLEKNIQPNPIRSIQ